MDLDYRRLKKFWDQRASSNEPDLKGFNLGTTLEQHEFQIKTLIEQMEIHDQYVIDLGCGAGRISMLLAQRVKAVTAVDFSDETVNLLRDNLKKNNIKNVVAVKGNCFDLLPVQYGTFDVAIIFGVLLHLNDADVIETILNSKKLLKSDGKVIVRESIGIESRYEIDKFSEELKCDYCAIYRTRNEIEEAFKENGFSVKVTKFLYQQRKETATWFWVFQKIA